MLRTHPYLCPAVDIWLLTESAEAPILVEVFGFHYPVNSGLVFAPHSPK
jgi:hypothetical protein